MAEQPGPLAVLVELGRLPQQVAQSVIEELAPGGLAPEARALLVAVLGDATRLLLPGPLGSPLRRAARTLLAETAPEAAAVATALDNLVSTLAGLIALTPALTLGVLLGLAAAPKS